MAAFIAWKLTVKIVGRSAMLPLSQLWVRQY